MHTASLIPLVFFLFISLLLAVSLPDAVSVYLSLLLPLSLPDAVSVSLPTEQRLRSRLSSNECIRLR
jgi:hypothetical protein